MTWFVYMKLFLRLITFQHLHNPHHLSRHVAYKYLLEDLGDHAVFQVHHLLSQLPRRMLCISVSWIFPDMPLKIALFVNFRSLSSPNLRPRSYAACK